MRFSGKTFLLVARRLIDIMTKNRPWYIGISALAFAASASVYTFFLFSLTPTTSASAASDVRQAASAIPSGPIRIGTFSTGIDYAPFIVAKAKGWLPKPSSATGNEVEYVVFQTLPAINEAFASKRLDVVFEAEVPAIVGRASGIDLSIVGLEATLHEGILVPTKSSATNLQSLKGKRVAALAGTAMHFGLLKLLKGVGLDQSAVTVVNMVPPDAAAAFVGGQVDGMAFWPPWPEQLVQDGKGRFLGDGTAAVQSVIVMRHQFATGRAEQARAIVAAITRAKTWLKHNREAGITLVAKELRLPVPVVKLSWPKLDWSAEITNGVKNDLQEKADFLVQQKMTQHSVRVSDLVLSRI